MSNACIFSDVLNGTHILYAFNHTSLRIIFVRHANKLVGLPKLDIIC